MKIDLSENGRLALAAQDNTSKNLNKKIMIIAGGTGGHVMPALAVAQYLKEYFQHPSDNILWLGTRAGIEAHLVPQAGFAISYIDIQGLRRTKWTTWFLAPWQMTKALFQSFCILWRERPDVVLSMGGFASGPSAIAAWILRIPLILHEQNAISGWTNRFLSTFASRIIVAFPNAFAQKKIKPQNIFLAGNPIRENILTLPPPEIRFKQSAGEPVRLLVLGGSQGASILNEIIPKALSLLPFAKRPQVWHQTGKNHLTKTQENYQKLDSSVKLSEFIEDMAKAYAWADIVICRSGALTIAELSAVGIASILIPFPYAVDDHQTANAKYLSSQNAAYLLPQTALTPEKLNKILLEMIDEPLKRLEMAKASRQLAHPLATTIVAKHCLEVKCG